MTFRGCCLIECICMNFIFNTKSLLAIVSDACAVMINQSSFYIRQAVQADEILLTSRLAFISEY